MMGKNGKFIRLLTITLGVLVGLNLIALPAGSPATAAEFTIRAATIVIPTGMSIQPQTLKN